MPKPALRLLVCILLVLIASAAFLQPAFGAPTLWEYFNSGDNDADGFGGSTWKAQTFTVGAAAHTVTSVKVKLVVVGTPQTFTISIRETSGGVPTGSDKTSGTATIATGWVTVSMTEYSLSASTIYAYVIRCTTSACNAGSSYGNVRRASTAGYSGGVEYKSTNSGSSWTPQESVDDMFEIWGNAAVVTTTTTTTALVYTTNYGAETATVLTTLTNNATETEYSTHLTTVLGATNTLSTTTTTSLATNTTLLTTTRTTTSFAIQNSTWTTNTTTTANVTTTSNTATATSLSTTTLTESALSTTTNTTTIGTSTHLATLTTPITTLLTTFTGGTSTIGTTTTTTTAAPTVIIRLIYTERRTTTISSYFTEQLRITQNRTYTQFDQEWVTQTNETLEILRTILYDTLVIINSTITTIVIILVPYLAGGTESYAVLAVIFGAGSVLILFAVEAKRR